MATRDGHRLLRRRMKILRLSQADVCREVGASAALVSLWVAGDRVPGLGYAMALAEWSEGAIPVESWLEAKRNRKKAA